MIYFITTSKHTYTIQTFLDEWAPEIEGFIKIMTYDELIHQTTFQKGAYFFTDIERLPTHIRFLSDQIWQKMAECKSIQLYNRPERSMRRYELLTTLYSKGKNKFQIRRLNDDFSKIRFPVFLRGENDHWGTISELIYNTQELKKILKEAIQKSKKINELLVVEFLDVSKQINIYKKYSAYRVGSAIIPRHIVFSDNWQAKKYPSLINEEYMEEEKSYLNSNPHKKELEEIFKIANINYGRIDYSILNGEIQIWEINTNPNILKKREVYNSFHLNNQELFAQKLKTLLKEINEKNEENKNYKISLDKSILLNSKFIKYKERISKNVSQTLLKLINSCYVNTIIKN